MSYAIPHFRDTGDASLEMRLSMAEAALKNMRRYAGRPEPIDMEAIMPPVQITLPPIRDLIPPPIPAFEPAYLGPTDACGGLPDGFIITPTGLRPRA